MPPDNSHLRDQSLRRARNAINSLVAAGERVTVSAVARKGGVSRSWIYTCPEIQEEIRIAADRQPPPNAVRGSEVSLRARVRHLLEENSRLRGEVQELRQELEVALGELRDTRLHARRAAA